MEPSGASGNRGRQMRVQFDRSLRRSSLPDKDAFAVTPRNGGAPIEIEDVRIPDDPTRLLMTLSRPLSDGERATASYRLRSSAGLKDTDGNILAPFSAEVTVGEPPAGTTALVSDPGDDATYAAGDTVRVRLTFFEAVEVDTTLGTPRLKLDLDRDGGSGERWADYEGGTGTTELTFAYVASSGDMSADGVAVLADTLEPNGGAIRSAATRTAAALGHAGLDHDPAHRVDAEPPRLLRGEIDGGTMTLFFSEALDPDWTGGKFDMAVEVPEQGVTGFRAAGGVTVEGATVTVGMGEPYPRATAGLDRNSVRYFRRVDGADGALRDLAGNPVQTAHRSLLHSQGGTVELRYVKIDLVNVTGKAPSEAERPLTASFVNMPAEHDGTHRFGFELRFSEDFPGRLRYKMLRDEAFDVKNGRVRKARRVTKGQNQRWTISVRPDSFEDVVVTLPAGSVVTEAGRSLANTVTATVRGPAALSVADARANEADEALAFTVSLSRAASGTVTVDYATRDGTAKAGEDYTATGGTLSFAAGELEKTVSVPLLDDAIDEGEETFTLKLRNAQGAAINDGEATGTIENSDPLQKMWLSRFGRTVASHVTDAVSDRLANPLSGAQVTVGGQSVNLAETDDGDAVTQTLTAVARLLGAPSGPASGDDPDGFPGSGPWQAGAGLGLRVSPTLDSAPAREISGRELLLGSAFHLAREGDSAGPGLAAWGRVTVGGFDGEAPADNGSVTIDGEVITGVLGADAEWNRLLAGVAVSVSEGEGKFEQPGVDKGTIESTMTTMSPYARFTVNDRVSVWGLAGWGTGDMTIMQDARAAADGQPARPERISRTDIEMRLAALGGRGALLQADEAGGFDLALKADAFYVETESDPISNEDRTTAAASRVRLALEGSRAFQVGGGTLTPGLELGLRHDGGDAETGTGVELGGRVSWTDPETGLSVEAHARTLIAHEDSDYREWGASGAVRLSPGERGRGLSFSLAPTYGAASSGVDRLWSARDANGLAPGTGFEAEQRLEGELGYGLSVFDDRFTGTPNVGFGLSDTARDYRIGWRLTSAVRGDSRFEVNLDATRRESANGNEPAEHGVMLRGAIRW